MLHYLIIATMLQMLVPVLLEEIILQQLGDFQCDLVGLGKRGLADKLNDFRKIFFFLQNFFNLGAKRNKFGEMTFVMVIQSPHVFATSKQNSSL